MKIVSNRRPYTKFNNLHMGGALLVRGHLLEAHLEEDLAELGADLVEGVQGAGALVGAEGLEVAGFEGCGLPGARGQHLGREIGGLLGDLEGELGALVDPEGDDLLRLDELALLQVGEDLGVGVRPRRLDRLQLLLGDVLYRVRLFFIYTKVRQTLADQTHIYDSVQSWKAIRITHHRCKLAVYQEYQCQPASHVVVVYVASTWHSACPIPIYAGYQNSPLVFDIHFSLKAFP